MVVNPITHWWNRPLNEQGLIIPARHPVQLFLVLGLFIASVFRLSQPQPASSALLIPYQMYVASNIVMFIGSALLIMSAIFAKAHAWLSMGLSLAGMLALSGVLAYYTHITMNQAHFGWAGMTTFWFIGSMFLGFFVRAIQLVGLTIKIQAKGEIFDGGD